MKCPICNGVGGFYDSICYRNDMYDSCPFCDGKGSIPFLKWVSYKFWTNVPCWFVELWDKVRYGVSDDYR